MDYDGTMVIRWAVHCQQTSANVDEEQINNISHMFGSPNWPNLRRWLKDRWVYDIGYGLAPHSQPDRIPGDYSNIAVLAHGLLNNYLDGSWNEFETEVEALRSTAWSRTPWAIPSKDESTRSPTPVRNGKSFSERQADRRAKGDAAK